MVNAIDKVGIACRKAWRRVRAPRPEEAELREENTRLRREIESLREEQQFQRQLPPVDYTRLMPLTYAFALLIGAVGLLTLTADIVNPIRLQ